MSDMANLPSVCKQCGRLSQSPILGLFPGMELQIEVDLVSICPYCGGDTVVPHGVYEFIDEAERIIENWTPAQRQRVSRAIEQAQRAQDRSAATSAIEAEPGLADIARRFLVPRDAGDFWAMIAVLVAVLALTLDDQSSDPPKVVNKTVIENKITVSPSDEKGSASNPAGGGRQSAKARPSSKGKARRQSGGGARKP